MTINGEEIDVGVERDGTGLVRALHPGSNRLDVVL